MSILNAIIKLLIIIILLQYIGSVYDDVGESTYITPQEHICIDGNNMVSQLQNDIQQLQAQYNNNTKYYEDFIIKQHKEFILMYNISNAYEHIIHQLMKTNN